MKKVLFILCSLFAFATITNAQTADTKTQTKEEKQKAKEKKEAAFEAAFKEAGLTDQEIELAKAAMQEASEKSNTVKKDASLSEDEKATKLKEISDAKNSKLKEIMGSKYKAYSAARKKQKEATEAAGN